MKDGIVRVKLVKRFKEQRPVSYVGKVVQYDAAWIVVDGFMLMLSRHVSSGVIVDKKVSRNYIPRDNIESVHMLPNEFDVKNLKFSTNEQQIVMEVPGAQSCFIGEMGEG